jgi:hypothetical protein
MRDHTKLRAFDLADALALAVYKATANFPREEMFGLTSQLRGVLRYPSPRISWRDVRDFRRPSMFISSTWPTVRHARWNIRSAFPIG